MSSGESSSSSSRSPSPPLTDSVSPRDTKSPRWQGWLRKKSTSAPVTPREGGTAGSPIHKTSSGGKTSDGGQSPKRKGSAQTIDLVGEIQVAHVRHERLPAAVLPQLLGLLRERGIACEVYVGAITENTVIIVVPMRAPGKIKLKYIKRVSVPQMAVDGVAAMCSQGCKIHKFDL